MDSNVVTPSRPSGLPRPASRLPMMNKKSSQIFSPLPAKQLPGHSTTRDATANASSKLQKRASVTPIRRALPNTVPNAASRPTSSRDSSFNATRPVSSVSKSSTGSRGPLTRPSSRSTRQHTRPLTAEDSQGDTGENNDLLGSLNGFRSASRQGSIVDNDIDNHEYEDDTADSLFRTEKKHPRPSLSDRVIESLQNLPSTPKDRRRSSFFAPPESPMGPPPRPISAMSRNGSNGSRPGTSDGVFPRPSSQASSPTRTSYASAKPATRTAPGGFGFTPKTTSRRSVSAAFTPRTYKERGATNSNSRPSSPSKLPANPRSRERQAPRDMGASKTLASRPAKQRPTVGKTFTSTAHVDARSPQQTAKSPLLTSKSVQRAVSGPVSASSTLLREQIAAAKAAARREKERAIHDSPQASTIEDGNALEHAYNVDPFNQAPRDEKHILRNRVNAARMDGRLNISAMSLTEIPVEVMTMFEPIAMEENNVNWAEVVDLTRLIMADNELEVIADTVFPDLSLEKILSDDDTAGNQFGGLETLDLHGNALLSLPIGLRRLERLTVLDLAHNKLENSALDVVSQILTLKDIRLGHNCLGGNLPNAMCNLSHLEVLNLQGNRLLGLPEALRNMVSLKVLNLAGNQLTTLPMEAIQQLPLIELDASNNALIGSLFPLGGQYVHHTLRTIDVSHNSLAALIFSDALELPQLRELRVTNNHLTVLPPFTTWSELATLLASDNKISNIPIGFTDLRKLRNVNFACNDFKTLDPEIGRMDGLESFIIASNPLREKKFLSMSAADTCRELKSRLAPENTGEDQHTEDEFVDASDSFSSRSNTTSVWPIQANGILDLAAKNLSDDVNDTLGSFLKSNEVKHLLLQANKLTAVPPALWLGQDLKILNLSSNVLGSDYFCAELELPALTELKLSNCRLGTMEPLLSQLSAPSLRSLDVSTNRLVGSVPILRNTYPALTSFWASDNRFVSITADAVRGMSTINLTSNDIESLPAEIGLLWDEGLKHFEVGSNAFRVPNYRILEKGTEATLRWLRDRLPAGFEERRRIELDLD